MHQDPRRYERVCLAFLIVSILAGVGLFLLPSSVSFAAILTVPGSYSTIQEAIDAAADGDEIVVSPGTYQECVRFDGKNVILRSTNPTDPAVVASTILDGNYEDTVVGFAGTETPDCVLSGFTITGGVGMTGGAIFGFGTHGTIENNVITGNGAYCGGGLYECNGMIRNNIISYNAAGSWGGGLYGCHGTIENNTFRGNHAGYHGSALQSCGGTVQNNTIIENTTSGEEYLGDPVCGCYGSVLNNVISDNHGAGLSGCEGVIRDNTISDNGSAGLTSCDGTIENNTIYGNIGGLSYCTGIIQNNDIFDNSSHGLAHCSDIIRNNTVSGNAAGGLYRCSSWIEGNIISGNSSGMSGGGLDSCRGHIRNNIIVGNSARWGGGLDTCGPFIENNTIYGNVASERGGGVHWCDGAITNCIIWANEAPSSAQVGSAYPHKSQTVSYCCIQGWPWDGEGNISVYPQLVDPDHGDFHLHISSPCVDAGCYVDGLTEDFEGDARPTIARRQPSGDGSFFDIGADEVFGDADSDHDGIPNSDEGTGDVDGDGVPNYLDRCSDSDSVSDALETAFGTDPYDADDWPDLPLHSYLLVLALLFTTLWRWRSLAKRLPPESRPDFTQR